jgi:predicted aspartyl protease
MSTAEAIGHTEGPPRLMGQVFAEIELRNALDEWRAREGLIDASEVRSVALSDVLVDTGATHLCLPADIVAALGLPVKREVPVQTANGTATRRLMEGVRLRVAGRDTVVECIELPEGSRPLLGAVPMEVLGLEPDLQNRRLRVLPLEEGDTYILLY